MSPLHSWGFPTLRRGSKIRTGCLTPTFSGAQKRAEMLHQPCIVRGPQRQARGAKSEMAASPLLSRGPKRGRKCYISPRSPESRTPSAGSNMTSGCLTPTFLESEKGAEMLRHHCTLGGPNAKRGEQNRKRLPHTYFLGVPKKGGNATSPLHSRGSRKPSGEQTQKWLPQPYVLGGPKEGGNAMPPLHSRGPHHQAQEAKSEVVASPLLSRGPKRGRKCYVTPAFSGVPNTKRGEQNRKWLPHTYFLGGPKEGGDRTPPPHSRRSPTPSPES